MRQSILSILSLLAISVSSLGHVHGTTEEHLANPVTFRSDFHPFTGKVSSNKVRLRLHPNLDAMVLKELHKGDMLVVVGESEDFYAVKPPSKQKAYIFRTFVLENMVEGSHVNVRLQPDLDSPVIAQLNTGDRVAGAVCKENSKWLEIPAPETVQFYVAKDYLENVGGPEFLAMMEQRQQDLGNLLEVACAVSGEEMDKPFEEIDLALAMQHYETLIDLYPDYPTEVEQAKEALAQLQECYLMKKLDYLERKAAQKETSIASRQSSHGELSHYQTKLDQLEAELSLEMEDVPSGSPLSQPATWIAQNRPSHPPFKTDRMARWEAIELGYLDGWLQEHGDKGAEDYYLEEQLNCVTLTGVLEPYDRPVQNKPGDYILLDPRTHRTIAFVYSTKVNLQDRVGKEVTLSGTRRPNNNFAFPAYCALSVR